MSQESQDNPNLESPEIIANDNAILNGEVWAKVDDTSVEVFRAVEKVNFLDKILWRISDPGAEIARLDKLRLQAVNDNIENEKAA